jgi:Phage protein D
MIQYPRCWIEIYDPATEEYSPVRWSDLLDVTIENTLYLAADSCEIVLKNDKLLSDWLRKEQEVKVWLGYVQNPDEWTKEELEHIFTGKIDGVRPEFTARHTVQLVGRDYSAPLLDTEYNLAFAERTSSQIAELLAEKRGLIPKVTPTESIVARDIYKDKKEWEILQELAEHEGYVCYVTEKKELYFGPRNDQDEELSARFVYRGEKEKSNLKKITFDDSNIGIINKVVVRRWVGKSKQLIEATAKNDDLIKKYGEKVRVVTDSKVKTIEQAMAKAEKLLKEWSRSVVTAESVEVNGDSLLKAEKKVEIVGCGRFDSAYYIDRIRHKLTRTEGYRSELDLTSQRPDSAAQYRRDLYNYEAKTM